MRIMLLHKANSHTAVSQEPYPKAACSTRVRMRAVTVFARPKKPYLTLVDAAILTALIRTGISWIKSAYHERLAPNSPVQPSSRNEPQTGIC